MARCGRCGLWARTPAGHKEQKYRGVCLWYKTRLEPEFEYEERECESYIENIPPYDASWHLDFKIKRDNLGDAYEKAKASEKKAKIALGFSIVGIVLSVTKLILG